MQLLDGRRPQARPAQQRRRAGQAADQPAHPLRHDHRRRRAVVVHRDATSRACRRAALKSSRNPGLALPPADRAHADDRHRRHHVARRADHRPGHRQRLVADHLRRHRRRDARRAHPLPRGRRRRRRRRPRRPVHAAPRHRRRSPRSATSSARTAAIPVQYTKRQVGRKMYSGRAELSAAQDQRLGRHPADLRVVDPDVPGADREHVGLALDAGVLVDPPSGGLALQPDLHGPRSCSSRSSTRRSCSTPSTSRTT